MDLTNEKYISFTTSRKSGETVSSPVWIVPLENGRFGFWTSSASGKVKRVRNNPAVSVRPCDQRGRVDEDAPTVTGSAELVSSGADFDAIQRTVRAKYGMMVPISRMFNKIGHLGKKFPYGDMGVIVTPAATP